VQRGFLPDAAKARTSSSGDLIFTIVVVIVIVIDIIVIIIADLFISLVGKACD